MITVVVPVHNEAENIHTLISEIYALKGSIPLAEILYVNDGSTDGTLAALQSAKAACPILKVVSQTPRSGQSCAIWTGVQHAAQPIIITLDGDGQNDPASMVGMVSAFLAQSGATPRLMVAGQRARREDNWLRKFSSRVANGVRSRLLDDGVRDTGCGLKLFRRDDFLALPYFNHMHRFLPALMIRAGVTVALADVNHRPRQLGTSKYGVMNRLWVGIVDLCGVMWLKSRARPVHLNVRED